MTHLQRPRVHFSGEFFTDPSTINNYPANYAPGRVGNRGWNANGLHTFRFHDCRIRRALHDRGVETTSSGDRLVDASVETPEDPTRAKIVDLDPRYQSGTEIYALTLRLMVGGVAVVRGRVRTMYMHDLWMQRGGQGGIASASGSLYGIVDDLSFAALSGSRTLAALRRQRILTLKLTLYGYDRTNFRGSLVGTLGPGDPAKVSGWVGRRLSDALAQPTAFGAAEVELDESRRRLTIDLSNAMPEQAPAGERVNLGRLTAQVITGQSPGASPTGIALGTLDYSRMHFLTTAGVEELDLTPAQVVALRDNPLTLVDGGDRQLLAERPDGLSAVPKTPVLRLQPYGGAAIPIHVTRFGRPAANQLLMALTVPAAGSRPEGMMVPSTTGPMPLRTNARGIATLNLAAAQPAPMAGDHIDGEVYEIGIDADAVGPSNRLTAVHVRVFDGYTEPADPRWADVQPILAQYAQLYPGMSARMPGGLGAHATYTNPGYRAVVAEYLRYPAHDSRHMPVTRDLSDAKRRTLLRWLDRGAR